MSEDIKKSLGFVSELPPLLINESENEDVVKSIKDNTCTLHGRLNARPDLLPIQKSLVKGEPIEKAHMIVLEKVGDLSEAGESQPDYLKNTHGEDWHDDADKEMIQYFTTTKQIDPARCPVYNPPTQPDPRGLFTGAGIFTRSEKVEQALDNICKSEVKKGCSPKFKRCVRKVKAKGEGVNPYAVCHTSVGKSELFPEPAVKAKDMAPTPSKESERYWADRELLDSVEHLDKIKNTSYRVMSADKEIKDAYEQMWNRAKRRMREKAENVRKLSKSTGGEGSRGGHIIGHTKSGKPIYGEWSIHHTDFTEADHADAAKAYKKKGDKERARIHEKLSKPETYKEDGVVKAYIGFKKLSQQIGASGKVSNPKAVAAAIGRKKYGKQAFQAAAAAGHKMKSFEEFHDDLVKSYAWFLNVLRNEMVKSNVHFKPYKPPRPGALIHQPKSKEQARQERAQRKFLGFKRSETGVKDVSFGGQSFFVSAAENGGEVSKAEEEKPWPGEGVSEFWGKPHGWHEPKKKPTMGKKTGEGARGGHVVGHTKSGEPIYSGHKQAFQSKVDPMVAAGQQVKEQKAQEAKEAFGKK